MASRSTAVRLAANCDPTNAEQWLRSDVPDAILANGHLATNDRQFLYDLKRGRYAEGARVVQRVLECASACNAVAGRMAFSEAARRHVVVLAREGVLPLPVAIKRETSQQGVTDSWETELLVELIGGGFVSIDTSRRAATEVLAHMETLRQVADAAHAARPGGLSLVR